MLSSITAHSLTHSLLQSLSLSRYYSPILSLTRDIKENQEWESEKEDSDYRLSSLSLSLTSDYPLSFSLSLPIFIFSLISRVKTKKNTSQPQHTNVRKKLGTSSIVTPRDHFRRRVHRLSFWNVVVVVWWRVRSVIISIDPI
jgi:hypothetical protein